jgi:hypothetical protein
LQFSLQAASPETFGYTLLHGFPPNRTFFADGTMKLVYLSKKCVEKLGDYWKMRVCVFVYLLQSKENNNLPMLLEFPPFTCFWRSRVSPVSIVTRVSVPDRGNEGICFLLATASKPTLGPTQ